MIVAWIVAAVLGWLLDGVLFVLNMYNARQAADAHKEQGVLQTELDGQLASAQEHFEEDSKQLHTLVDELHSVREERDALKTALDKEILRSSAEASATPRTPGKGIPPKRPRQSATRIAGQSDRAAGSVGEPREENR